MNPPIPNGHYYSPVPDKDEVQRDRARIWPDPMSRELPGINLNIGTQRILANDFARFSYEAPWHDEPQPGLRYSYVDGGRNAYFRHADALYLFGFLRTVKPRVKPRRVIEVGCGYSSAVMLDTSERFLSSSVDFTFIDPEAERIERLLDPGDREHVIIYKSRVQDIPLDLFDQLQSGDLLFIDSSHVSKVGSDVNFLLFEVLPLLVPGVFIHVHDIYWPFEYPEYWIEHGIFFNEAYLLHALLMDNPRYEILLWADYLRHFHSDGPYNPDHVDAHSLYLRICP